MIKCKRSSTDPLLRMLLDEYGMHLLNRPHQEIECGHLLAWKDESLHHFAIFEKIFGEPFGLAFPSKENKFYQELQNRFSGDLSIGLAANVTRLLARICGLPLEKVKAAFKKANSTDVRVALNAPSWHQLDVPSVYPKLFGLDASPIPAYKGWKFFLVSDVYRSKGVTFMLESNIAAEVRAALEAEGMAAGAKLNVANKTNRDLTWRLPGSSSAIFGVGLLEMHRNKNGWDLKGVDKAMRIRGASAGKISHSFAGDIESGPAFLNLSG